MPGLHTSTSPPPVALVAGSPGFSCQGQPESPDKFCNKLKPQPGTNTRPRAVPLVAIDIFPVWVTRRAVF